MNVAAGFDVDAVLAGVGLGLTAMAIAWTALIGLSLARRMLGADEDR